MGQTRIKLLKEAYTLMCTNGYSAFSYADLAKKIGISKASIHHHFPIKENLAEEVICSAYTETKTKLHEISQDSSRFIARIEQYINLFSYHSDYSQLPLCCSLSSEFANLPSKIQLRTQEYFQLHIHWLKDIILDAKNHAEIPNTINEDDLAFTILKLFEGTSIVARVLSTQDHFQHSLNQIKALIQ